MDQMRQTSQMGQLNNNFTQNIRRNDKLSQQNQSQNQFYQQNSTNFNQ
jgi:hypothetical protein